MSLSQAEKEEKAVGNSNLMQFAVSWLVWPVALASLVTLSYRCYKERKFLDALPLLATQLNSTFIWSCLAAYQVGYYNHFTNGTYLLRASYDSLNSRLIRTYLNTFIYLEPLNLFLYTWRFLDQLEQEEPNKVLKLVYKWFARVSIVFLPICFLCFVPTFIFEISEVYYNEGIAHFAEAKHAAHIRD